MNHLSAGTALLVLGGGGYAFVKAKSTASLAGSIFSASLFLSSNYLISKTDNIFSGCVLGGLGGASLLGVSYIRWGKGKSSRVPIALLILGSINLVYYTMKAWEWRDTRSKKIGMS